MLYKSSSWNETEEQKGFSELKNKYKKQSRYTVFLKKTEYSVELSISIMVQ